MIYTTYLGNKNIPNGAAIFSIMRFPVSDKIINLQDYAPSKKLFDRYTNGKIDSFKDFKRLFVKELEERLKRGNSPLRESINAMKNFSKHQDVYLVCTCRDSRYCHRSVVAKLIGALELK